MKHRSEILDVNVGLANVARSSRQFAADLNSRDEDETLVYQFRKQDMIVTFSLRDDRKRIVQLALGSEMRTFELEEFTDFWLTMIEEGRKATSGYLESFGKLARQHGQ